LRYGLGRFFFYGTVVSETASNINIFTTLTVESRLERKCCLDGELVMVGESL